MNLRYMLIESDTNQPVDYGLLYKAFIHQGYMAGGPGYVLSKEGLRRFIDQALPDKDKCKQSHHGGGDAELGKCLDAVGADVGDTRDALNLNRFMAFLPEHHLDPEYSQNWTIYGQKKGMECCSDLPISFHYVSPNRMLQMEFLLYRVRLYSVSRDYDWNEEPKLNMAPDSDDVTPLLSISNQREGTEY